MSAAIEDSGMTSTPGKDVGEGLMVGISCVGLGEEVGEAGGVAL